MKTGEFLSNIFSALLRVSRG